MLMLCTALVVELEQIIKFSENHSETVIIKTKLVKLVKFCKCLLNKLKKCNVPSPNMKKIMKPVEGMIK